MKLLIISKDHQWKSAKVTLHSQHPSLAPSKQRSRFHALAGQGNNKEPDERSPISVTISYFGYSLIASDAITYHRFGFEVGMPSERRTECKVNVLQLQLHHFPFYVTMLCRIHYFISECGASAANQVWVRHHRIMPPTENISLLLRTHKHILKSESHTSCWFS